MVEIRMHFVDCALAKLGKDIQESNGNAGVPDFAEGPSNLVATKHTTGHMED
jgi:hypothetical protein